jgi:hypothetical protein
MTARATAPWERCDVCGRMVPLRQDGRYQRHRERGGYECPGSRQLPKPACGGAG